MNGTLSYFLYVRKSSEDSQRQVASINDQINALNIVLEREGLELAAEPFKEERSAKDPGRPIFNEVLNRIERGEANALLVWDVDRLSRNPIDSGRLQWMLQKGVVRVIKTPGRSYYPEDAGLLMSIESGRATDYVMRLSKNVKRGLNSKALRGWRPSAGPIGYKNETQTASILFVRFGICISLAHILYLRFAILLTMSGDYEQFNDARLVASHSR
jgi:site-specific DNA recombinase